MPTRKSQVLRSLTILTLAQFWVLGACRDSREFFPGQQLAKTVKEVKNPGTLLAQHKGLQLIAYEFDGRQLRATLRNTGALAVDRVWLQFGGDAQLVDAEPSRQFRLLPNRHSKLLKAGADFSFVARLPGAPLSNAEKDQVSLRVVEVPASPSIHHVIPRKDWDPRPVLARGVTRYPKLSSAYLKWIVIHHTAMWNAPGPMATRDVHVDWRGWADMGYHFFIAEDGQIFTGRDLHLMGAHAGQTREANLGVWRARHPRPAVLQTTPMTHALDAGVLTDCGMGDRLEVQEGTLGQVLVDDKDAPHAHENDKESRKKAQVELQKRIDQARKNDPDYGSIGVVLDGDFSGTDAPTAAQMAALKELLADLQKRFDIDNSHIITHREVITRLVEERGLTFTGHKTTCPGDQLQRAVEALRNAKCIHLTRALRPPPQQGKASPPQNKRVSAPLPSSASPL